MNLVKSELREKTGFISYACILLEASIEEVKADAGQGSKCLFPQRSHTVTDKNVH